MDKTVLAGIEAKTKELEAAIFKRNGKDRVKEMIEKMKNGYQLVSLSGLFNQGPVFDPILPRTLDPATSGFSSDCFEHDDTVERAHSLSFTEVKNLLIDPSVMEVVSTDNSYPVDDYNLVLLLGDISSTVDYFSLETFLLGLKNPPEMLKVRFMFFKKKYSVAMQFKRPEQAKNFYGACSNRLANFQKILGSSYTVGWARVNSESKSGKLARAKRMALPVRFFRENFCGVVIRNIPEETKTEDIENFLGRKNLPCKIESINFLRNEYFGLVTMETVDMCEKACLLLNDRSINRKKLKAHIHPETCGRRDFSHVASDLRPLFKEDEDLASANLLRLKSLIEDAKLQEEVRKLEADLYKYRKAEVFDRTREHRDYHRKEPTKHYSEKHEKDHRRRDSRERHHSGREERDSDKRDTRRSKERHPKEKEAQLDERKRERKSPKHKTKSPTPSPKKDEPKSKDKPKESSPKQDAPEAGEVKPRENKWKKEGSQQKTDGGSEKRKGKESGRHRSPPSNKRRGSQSRSGSRGKHRRRSRTRSKERAKERDRRDHRGTSQFTKDESRDYRSRRHTSRRTSRDRRRSNSTDRRDRRKDSRERRERTGIRDKHKRTDSGSGNKDKREQRNSERRREESSGGGSTKDLQKINELKEKIRNRKKE